MTSLARCGKVYFTRRRGDYSITGSWKLCAVVCVWDVNKLCVGHSAMMLRILRPSFHRTSVEGIRRLSTTMPCSVKKILSETEGNTTTVQLVDIPDTDKRKVLKKSDDTCSLCTCNIPIKVKYSDVLILEQFMREDGTVLPRQLTGLCKKQQLRVERCVMQAHWAGLFPDRTIPDFDRAGYKRFNRYWNDDMDMYRLKQKTEQGTWYYVKRYRTVGGHKAKY